LEQYLTNIQSARRRLKDEIDKNNSPCSKLLRDWYEAGKKATEVSYRMKKINLIEAGFSSKVQRLFGKASLELSKHFEVKFTTRLTSDYSPCQKKEQNF
jgi:hypothetical protein